MSSKHITALPEGGPVSTACARCLEPCKQPAFVSVVACKRAGLSDWENLPRVQEIGSGHGATRPLLNAPHWLSVGRGGKPDDAETVSKAIGARKPVATLRRMTCPICGQVFEPRSSAHKYCSDACARAGARKRDAALKRRRRKSAEGE